eukprot:scaffold130582_cov30-Tisochrysis_lutea.AAC.4
MRRARLPRHADVMATTATLRCISLRSSETDRRRSWVVRSLKALCSRSALRLRIQPCRIVAARRSFRAERELAARMRARAIRSARSSFTFNLAALPRATRCTMSAASRRFSLVVSAALRSRSFIRRTLTSLLRAHLPRMLACSAAAERFSRSRLSRRASLRRSAPSAMSLR